MLCGSCIREARDLFGPGCKPVEIKPRLWRCDCCGLGVAMVKPGVWHLFKSTEAESKGVRK